MSDESEIAALRQQIEVLTDLNSKALIRIGELRVRVERMREVLEWYGNGENYRFRGIETAENLFIREIPVIHDYGLRARRALEPKDE